MNDREQRGLALAALYRIEEVNGKFIVPSQSGDGRKYTVDPEKRHCTCRDHEDRAIKCKHMFAVEFVQTRERNADGSVTVEKTLTVRERVTYKQDWPNYNRAQADEKHLFQSILADLCRTYQEPPRTPRRGRPAIPVTDLLFAVAFKVYSLMSTRRFSCDLKDAAARGHIGKALHYNSVCEGMERPDLTPMLKGLIVQSARPLRSVEKVFRRR